MGEEKEKEFVFGRQAKKPPTPKLEERKSSAENKSPGPKKNT